MSAPRSPVIFALLSAIESTYGTANAPTVDGWIITTEAPEMTEAFINDGARGLDNRSAGNLANTRMSGRSYEISLSGLMRGRPAALTGSTPPFGWHNWLRAAGFSATFNAGAWTYAPVSGNYASLTVDGFKHGLTANPNTFLRYRATGVYVEQVGIKAEAGGILEFTASGKGIGLAPTEEAFPSGLDTADVSTGTYKFDGLNIAANLITAGAANWTPVIASFEYSMQRELSERPSGNTPTAHAGFAAGRRTEHTVVLKVEATDLATYNPFTLKQAQTVQSLDVRFGSSAAGDRLQFLTSNAQLTEVAEEAEGGVSYWSLTFTLNGGANGNSDCSWIAS